MQNALKLELEEFTNVLNTKCQSRKPYLSAAHNIIINQSWTRRTKGENYNTISCQKDPTQKLAHQVTTIICLKLKTF
jgi:hypothetical protein